MKVILFGLTGLGSIVLEELLKKKVKVLSVSTRQEKKIIHTLIVKV